jgi:peptidoglycan/LPS O-acetylase OafA/YrhL
VLSVVVFHAFPQLVPGGFVGVDIFFVISGFLITRILLSDLRNGHFSLLAFYDRRIRRIFPALFAVLAVSTVVAGLLLTPTDLDLYLDSFLGTALFSSNFVFWGQAGYFDGAAELKPLLHTWSLAVEEQFYILFPLILWAAGRLRLQRRILWIGLLGSLALSVVAVRYRTDFAYYLIPSRAWELLIGAVIAIDALPEIRSRIALRNALGFAGLALILVSLFRLDRYTPFPGLAALLPCGGAALLIYSGLGGETVVGRMLSSKAIVSLGLISYSAYLWHWPILSFARYEIGPLSIVQSLAAVAVTFVLAALSWRIIERPFRHRSDPLLTATSPGEWRVVRTGLCAVAICALVGAAGKFALTDDRFVQALYGRDLMIISNQAGESGTSGGCLDSVDAQLGPDCRIGQPSQPADVAIWGDSIADSLLPAFRDAAWKHSAFAFVMHSCHPVLRATRTDSRPEYKYFGKKCRDFNERVLAELEQRDEIKTVIVVGNFSGMLNAKREGPGALVPDGYLPQMGTEQFRRMKVDRVVETLHRLTSMGKKVVVLGAYPTNNNLGAEAEARDVMAEKIDRRDFGVAIDAFDGLTGALNERLRAISGDRIQYVDPHLLFCPRAAADRFCHYDQAAPLLADGVHFSDYGNDKAAAAIMAAVHRQSVAYRVNRAGE